MSQTHTQQVAIVPKEDLSHQLGDDDHDQNDDQIDDQNSSLASSTNWSIEDMIVHYDGIAIKSYVIEQF